VEGAWPEANPRQAELERADRVQAVAEAELELASPRVLVLLGPTAAQTLLGRQLRVTRSRGVPIESELADLAVAAIHRSAVLRADDREDAFAGFVADLRAVSTFTNRGGK
jgi:DNA polymerase